MEEGWIERPLENATTVVATVGDPCFRFLGSRHDPSRSARARLFSVVAASINTLSKLYGFPIALVDKVAENRLLCLSTKRIRTVDDRTNERVLLRRWIQFGSIHPMIIRYIASRITSMVLRLKLLDQLN